MTLLGDFGRKTLILIGLGWLGQSVSPMLGSAAKSEAPPEARLTRAAVQHWLVARAQRVGATGAVILVRQGNETQILGVLPEEGPRDSGVIAAAQRAFRDKRVVRRLDKPDGAPTADVSAYVAFSLRILGRPAALALALRVAADKTDAAIISEIISRVLRRAEDAAGISAPTAATEPSIAPVRSSLHSARDAGGRSAPESLARERSALLAEQSAVISTLAAVMDQREFRRALHALADRAAQHWGCLRVTIGLVRAQRVAIEAVSGAIDFDSRSALMVDIAQALEETRAAASTIVLPCREKDDAPPQSHTILATQLKAPALLSLPLVDGDRVVGAVLFERDHEFSAEEQRQLERAALLLGPVIALKMLGAMGAARWFERFVRQQLEALLGSSRLGWKLGAIAASILVLWSSFYTQLFKINADANIEASVQRAVVASIPTFLTEVEKRAGDVVRQGDVLARLDVESLQLERINWVGELDKLAKEYRANLAQRDRSNIRILEARNAQAKSQIDLLDSQIARATVRAPIDGVVIAGDLSQALGAPVERGQLLFEVASLDDYRLVLMVDEADIGWVEIGQKGNLRLRSLPDQSFPFSVSTITPVSSAGDGANRFRVEGTFPAPPSGLRPGMEGVAKIDIEQRAIGWIWTHSFVNWLRLLSWEHGW